MQRYKYILSVLLILTSSCIYSQIEAGFRLGISSYDLKVGDLLFDHEETKITINEAQYGHHFGFYTRVQLPVVYIEPSILFTSSQTSYSLNNYTDQPLNTVFKESYLNLDLPLVFGTKLAFIRTSIGAIAHVKLSNTSELFEFYNYREKAKSAKYGYLLGLGFDLWNLRLDFMYENNLSSYSEYIKVGDSKLTNDMNPSRLILNSLFGIFKEDKASLNKDN